MLPSAFWAAGVLLPLQMLACLFAGVDFVDADMVAADDDLTGASVGGYRALPVTAGRNMEESGKLAISSARRSAASGLCCLAPACREFA